MNTALRQLCLPLAVLTAMSLSACASSSKDTTAPAQATGATSSSASSSASMSTSLSASMSALMSTSSTPSPTPSAGSTLLGKAQFVTKMEAVCVDFNTRIEQLPRPANAQDFTGIAATLQGTLKLFPQYIEQADALVARSADKATLTRNWLTPEKADFAASEPALKKFIADVKAKKRATVAADAQALDKLPDHSETIARFMSGYGLKNCAKLESS